VCLARNGFEVVLDETPCRLVLEAALHGRVDLNAVVYRADGHGVQSDESGDMEIFPDWGWTRRDVTGLPIVCLTAEAQRLKHRGYSDRPQDWADLEVIAHIHEPPRFDPTVRAIDVDERDVIAGIETASDRLLLPFGAWPLPPSDPAVKMSERARTLVTLVAGRPPVGFARLEEIDGHTHLGQLSVLPEYGRLGIGTSLVEAACEWASLRGHRIITLTTFADVPFNAPLYRRLGFDTLPLDDIGPELAQVIADEADLQPYGTRTTMVRPLRAPLRRPPPNPTPSRSPCYGPRPTSPLSRSPQGGDRLG